jgi:hypothetical protein
VGLRDNLKVLAGAVGTALTYIAEPPLVKAKRSPPNDDDDDEVSAKDEDAEPDQTGTEPPEDDGPDIRIPGSVDNPGNENQSHALGGDSEETPESAPVPTDKATKEPKALFWDPFAIIEQLGFRERPTSVSYMTLRAILWRMPIVQAIIQTRVTQVAGFSQPVKDRYENGFKLKLRDIEAEPTGADKKWVQQMTTLIQRTGVTGNPRGRDAFETFLKKFTFDSLVFDQACFEVVPNRKKQPAEWYAVDATTMRLADSSSAYVDEDKDKEVRYVQVYDGAVISEYTQEELCFGVRNPRTDIRTYGYGTSEMEMLVTTITAMLWAWDYNRNAFAQGSVQKGLLNFKGAIPDKQMKAFRRHWYSMLSGVENAWRTPILNADDVQWLPMNSSNRDMEYNAWMDFLIKVACSMYLIDPVEVNFKYGNTGQRSAMGETHNRDKIIDSKERGLKPILRFIERCLNQYIVWPINEAFEFKFQGLDQDTRDELADRNMKLVKSTRTVNELRAEDDLPPIPGKTGDLILDPVFWQAKAQEIQQEQQAQQGQMGGQPGGPPNGFGEPQSNAPDFAAMLGQQSPQNAQGAPGSDQMGAGATQGSVEDQESLTGEPGEKSMMRNREPMLGFDIEL